MRFLDERHSRAGRSGYAIELARAVERDFVLARRGAGSNLRLGKVASSVARCQCDRREAQRQVKKPIHVVDERVERRQGRFTV